jgi:hypothetical protein
MVTEQVEVAAPADFAVADMTGAGTASSQGGAGLWLYAAAIFTSAFLLFQVQLIISKYILPWFGGTAAVWTTAMLFFQVLLLAGYGYAHLLSTRLAPGRQVRLHMAVLALAVVVLAAAALFWRSPIMPGAEWKPLDPAYPVWRILGLLAASVGLPFLVLSSTSPLLQAWYARVYPRLSPYRLYALSNVGSLMGLVAYPFVVEPHVALRLQGWLWSALFALFAACCCGCAWLAKDVSGHANATRPRSTAAIADNPSVTMRLLWVALAAAASCMLLATTNKICQDVAVIPFLWVLPLVLYLLSFIICFDRPGWYRREIFHPLYAVAMAVLGAVLLQGASANVLGEVASYSFALFAICMVCHGELVRLKPAKHHLTSFYLLVAGGGAIGGLFVGLLAPRVFNDWWELHVAVASTALLLGCVLLLETDSWLRQNPYWIPPLILAAIAGLAFHAGWRQVLLGTVPGKAYCAALVVLAIPAIAGLVRREAASAGRVGLSQACFAAAVLLLGASLVWNIRGAGTDRVGGGRNFFGVLVLMDSTDHAALGLRHGKIVHGYQVKYDPMRPTAYFTPESGIGRLLVNHPRRRTDDPTLRVGVIGLGVGTLAAYSRPGDYYRFYEINPLVAEFSVAPKPEFTFLKNASGKLDLVMGDARLSMEREAENGNAQRFDVLVLDAFSSDAIPVHLLTKEVMEVYLKHLRGPESVIAMHITNKTLNLRPVVLGLCRQFGLTAAVVSTGGIFSNDWILLSRDPQALQIPEVQSAAKPLRGPQLLWTDDFSNLYQVIRQ